jgi:F-type H+-transporting ATPase subunit epsilon
VKSEVLLFCSLRGCNAARQLLLLMSNKHPTVQARKAARREAGGLLGKSEQDQHPCNLRVNAANKVTIAFLIIKSEFLHEPVLSLLVDGVVRIETTDGAKVSVAVHGGFFAVDSNEVKVLAEVAELDTEIDVTRAQAALDRANGSESPELVAAYRRAETRLKAAAETTASGLHN